MAKEEIKVTEVRVSKLDPTKAYVVQVEVGNMPKEHVQSFAESLTKRLVDIGFSKDKLVIAPVSNGLGELNFKEVKE